MRAMAWRVNRSPFLLVPRTTHNEYYVKSAPRQVTPHEWRTHPVVVHVSVYRCAGVSEHKALKGNEGLSADPGGKWHRRPACGCTRMSVRKVLDGVTDF